MSVLPDAVRSSVETELERFGGDPRVESAASVSGGCIHNGCRVQTADGATWFLKWSRDAAPGMFDAEADGLRALAEAGSARVPRPVAWRDASGSVPGWLLMEYVEPGRGRGGEDLGKALARIHGHGRASFFGWRRDNWIGSLPQANPQGSDWGRFWRDARLRPQVERARDRGRVRDGLLDRVLELTPDALSHVTAPALIHGDLWSGNTFTATTGEPVLIDPAVYRGDGEVDLAMSELFGGFGEEFYRAYEEARGISAEYRAYGRDLYQLYYLLVHVNLFGASYEADTLAAAERVVATLG